MPTSFLRGYYPMHLAIIAFVLIVFFLGRSDDFKRLQPVSSNISLISFVVAAAIVCWFYRPQWPAKTTPLFTSGLMHMGFVVILGWNTAHDTGIVLMNVLGISPDGSGSELPYYLLRGYMLVFSSFGMGIFVAYLFSRYFQPRRAGE